MVQVVILDCRRIWNFKLGVSVRRYFHCHVNWCYEQCEVAVEQVITVGLTNELDKCPLPLTPLFLLLPRFSITVASNNCMHSSDSFLYFVAIKLNLISRRICIILIFSTVSYVSITNVHIFIMLNEISKDLMSWLVTRKPSCRWQVRATREVCQKLLQFDRGYRGGSPTAVQA